jgi:probable addiction module antidote protein
MEPDPTPSNPAEYFGSEDEILDYLNFWMQEGSWREIARAVGDVARSRGLAQVSLMSRTEPQALTQALLPDGNPTLELLMAVLHALGLELSVRKTSNAG